MTVKKKTAHMGGVAALTLMLAGTAIDAHATGVSTTGESVDAQHNSASSELAHASSLHLAIAAISEDALKKDLLASEDHDNQWLKGNHQNHSSIVNDATLGMQDNGFEV